MLTVSMTSKFRKDFKRLKRRNKDIPKLHRVVELLSKEQTLDESYRDHALTGNYAGFRELHIEPDWLLIYCIQDDVLMLSLIRTGTHSDLFRQ